MLEKIYNFHEALKQLSIMVDLLPDDKTVWIQRGLVYQEMGNHELAINDFEIAIELDPQCSIAMFYMAKSKLAAGYIDQSIQDFERSEAITPTPAIQDGLGCCYHSHGDYDKAISSFTTAISAEPRNIEFLKNRSSCYYEMKDYPQSIEDLTSALEINPRDPQVLYKQGLSYF